MEASCDEYLTLAEFCPWGLSSFELNLAQWHSSAECMLLKVALPDAHEIISRGTHNLLCQVIRDQMIRNQGMQVLFYLPIKKNHAGLVGLHSHIGGSAALGAEKGLYPLKLAMSTELRLL